MNSHSPVGASQSAVRRRWLSLWTVWPSHLKISFLSTAILLVALEKARSRREPNLSCRGADRPGWCDCFAKKKKSLHESCRLGRRIDANSVICSLGHCECDGHRVHKLSQRRLTADLLAPWDSDCSRMHSKVSSDWLPSYIKATRPVFEIFKMAGYFPVSGQPSLVFSVSTSALDWLTDWVNWWKTNERTKERRMPSNRQPTGRHSVGLRCD